MRLTLEDITKRVESVQIVRVYAKLDLNTFGYARDRDWDKLNVIKENDGKYLECLVIHVDIKSGDRWAKINTTMKEKRIKERLLKCMQLEYTDTQVGLVRTKLQTLIIKIVEEGRKYALDNKASIVAQSECELILNIHQKRHSPNGSFEDALLFIGQILDKHPEIEFEELEKIWKDVQVKAAMEI